MKLRVRLPWYLRLDWRNTRVLLALCLLEFPLTVACLTLFGIADPNTYRTKLWQEGWRHGWNSDPIDLLYAYANYRPVNAPAPWAQFTTDWNVVIAVLSMFILLAKSVCYIVHVLPPFFSALVHAVLTAFYVVSAYRQAGPDYLNKDFPSPVPWMLSRGCGAPVSDGLWSACMQARASFAVAVVMSILFFAHFCLAAYCAVPTRTQREQALDAEKAEAAIKAFTAGDSPPTSAYGAYGGGGGGGGDKKFELELDEMPATPGLFSNPPMTPRTVAFQALEGKRPATKKARMKMKERDVGGAEEADDAGAGARRMPNRDLPLRHHISMGDEVYRGN